MMWKGIQNISKLKANNGSNITEISTREGSRLNDPIQIAKSFNSYFINVTNEITKRNPLTPKSPIKYLGEPLPNSFFLSSTTPTEVFDIISSLKDNKASGPNSIPIKLLKILNPHISVSLSIFLSMNHLNLVSSLTNLKLHKLFPFSKRMTLL